MPNWPRNPAIYEINTRPWLEAQGRQAGRRLTLAEVPGEAWDALAMPGIDAVWLMGVWERSPAGREIALANGGLREEFARALPDLREDDVIGSAYCVKSYEVDPALGGREGLRVAREELAKRGLRLVVDFVGNHVARDHAWVREHPDYFIRGDEQDAASDPAGYPVIDGQVFACGRDPFFPPWEDVLQLNPLTAGYRAAAIETLRGIAEQADGVRCDVAMLALNDVFVQTWGTRAGDAPPDEFWSEVIGATRASAPGFLFIAEAYWELEWRLQQLGFDYCYDKVLYDRLAHDRAASIRAHLEAGIEVQSKLLRFIENHDEARAAVVFEGPQGRAAATAVATLPGATLWHDGQFDGRKTRLPVFLARFPEEPTDADTRAFYARLVAAASHPALSGGDWSLCMTEGWPDNQGHLDFLAWEWQRDGKRVLIAINYSGSPRDGVVRLDPAGLAQGPWRFEDRLAEETFTRSGDELIFEGLYMALGPWATHVYEMSPE